MVKSTTLPTLDKNASSRFHNSPITLHPFFQWPALSSNLARESSTGTTGFFRGSAQGVRQSGGRRRHFAEGRKDHLVGSAIYNSEIADRGAPFFAAAAGSRSRFFPAPDCAGDRVPARRGIDGLCRLVWSESDGLPGVIVDRYGDHAVLQTLTLAMDLRKGLIVEALQTAAERPPCINHRAQRCAGAASGRAGVAQRGLDGRTAGRPVVIEVSGTPQRASSNWRSTSCTRRRRDFTSINWRITQPWRAGAGAARPGLFHQSGRIRPRLRASRRGQGDGGGSERGKYRKLAAKRRAQLPVDWIEQDVFQVLARGKGGS